MHHRWRIAALISGLAAAALPAIARAASESVVYSFTGGSAGANPSSALIDVAGGFLGTAPYGGANGYGVVYSVTLGGIQEVIYAFKGGSDGSYPQSALLKVKQEFLGTTANGGSTYCGGSGCGTIFSVTPHGNEKV